MVAKIDLHMHTINSGDGTLTPRELVNEVDNQGIEIFSITEHNTIKTYIDGDYELGRNQKLITGIELNTFIDGEAIELLCYGFDVKEALKIDYAKRNKKDIDEQIFNKAKLEFENRGFELGDVKYEGVRMANDLIFHALKEHKSNYLKVPELENMTITTFYRKNWCSNNSPFYVDTQEFFPGIDEIIRDFKDIGATVFLAHPYAYKNTDKVLSRVIDKVDGLECGHSMCSLENTIKLFELCKSKNKLISGGSDYHGIKSAIPKRLLGVYNLYGTIEPEIYQWVYKYL